MSQSSSLHVRRKTKNKVMMTGEVVAASIAWPGWPLIPGARHHERRRRLRNCRNYRNDSVARRERGRFVSRCHCYQFVATITATTVGTPIGIPAGTYMAEYGAFEADGIALPSTTSVGAFRIIIGLFVYELMVRPMTFLGPAYRWRWLWLKSSRWWSAPMRTC